MVTGSDNTLSQGTIRDKDMKNPLELYINIFDSSWNEIQLKIKPFKQRPNIDIIVQDSFMIPGLHDTGADITCMNEQTFRRIPVN